MSNMPTVDVVITTYRRPIEVLRRAVDSVVNQTYKSIDVAIVNDYPEDKDAEKQIIELIDSYNDKRLKYFTYEKNMGACYARNFGAGKLSGEFIEFLDDDDEWTEAKTEKQLAGFRNEKIGMVYSPFYAYGVGYKDGEFIERGTCEGNVTQDLLDGNKLTGCSMVMLRRSYFEQVDGFDVNMPSLQDYDLWLRLSLVCEAAYVGEPLIIKHERVDSISVNYTKKKNGRDLFSKKFAYLYEEHPEIYAKKLRLQFVESLRYHHVDDAMEYWREAEKWEKHSIKDCKYILLGAAKYLRTGVCSLTAKSK